MFIFCSLKRIRKFILFINYWLFLNMWCLLKEPFLLATLLQLKLLSVVFQQVLEYSVSRFPSFRNRLNSSKWLGMYSYRVQHISLRTALRGRRGKKKNSASEAWICKRGVWESKPESANDRSRLGPLAPDYTRLVALNPTWSFFAG